LNFSIPVVNSFIALSYSSITHNVSMRFLTIFVELVSFLLEFFEAF